MSKEEFAERKNTLTAQTRTLQNDIISLICTACKEKNIGGMFFQHIPQDKTYTVVDDIYHNDGNVYVRVEGFCISEDGRGIYLMTEDDCYNKEEQEDELVQETLDYVFLTPEHAEKFDEYFVTPIEDTFCPADTLNELLYTVQEMLQVLDENGYERISQSVQLKELEETTYEI